MRINLFSKTAVSCEDNLDPGPEACAGHRHGVTGEGPHHLLDLLDQILGFVARLCFDPQFINATQKNSQKGCRKGSREARPPPPTPP